ncbi:putative SP-containing membrane protein [Vairimorpha necatrix]|uniref:SP-containing membrane protein n=1 Tax=Vairimorpha necatrix TaxID=6039 RepID=A0AAX4JC36_9MICR
MRSIFYITFFALFIYFIKTSINVDDAFYEIINRNDSLLCATLAGNLKGTDLSPITVKVFAEFVWNIITKHLKFSYYTYIKWKDYLNEEKRMLIKSRYMDSILELFNLKEINISSRYALTSEENKFIDNLKEVTLEYYNMLNDCYKNTILADSSISTVVKSILNYFTCFHYDRGNSLPIIVVRMCQGVIKPHLKCFGEEGMQSIKDKVENNHMRLYISVCEDNNSDHLKYNFSDHHIGYDFFDDNVQEIVVKSRSNQCFLSILPYTAIPTLLLILILLILYYKKPLINLYKKITSKRPKETDNTELLFNNL